MSSFMERLRLNLGAAGYTEIDGGFLSPDAMAERKAETSAAVAGAARALALPAGLAPGRPRPDGGVALLGQRHLQSRSGRIHQQC